MKVARLWLHISTWAEGKALLGLPDFGAEPFAEPRTPEPNLRFRFGAVQVCPWGRYVWFGVRVEVVVGAPGVNRFEPKVPASPPSCHCISNLTSGPSFVEVP